MTPDRPAPAETRLRLAESPFPGDFSFAQIVRYIIGGIE